MSSFKFIIICVTIYLFYYFNLTHKRPSFSESINLSIIIIYDIAYGNESHKRKILINSDGIRPNITLYGEKLERVKTLTYFDVILTAIEMSLKNVLIRLAITN